MMSALNSLKELKSRIEKSRVSPGLSQEVTDHRTWMEKIRQHGNKPEDWLDFLRFMQQRTNYTGLKRCNFLSPLFEKALKDISDDNRRNEAFAQIFVDFAHLKGDFHPDVVDEMLNYARCLCKRAAVIYIASAEIKLKLGNPEKAKNILMKAQNVDALPADMTKEALHLLKTGHAKLMPRFLDDKIEVGNGTMSNNTTMEHLTSNNITGSLTCPNSASGNTMEHRTNSALRSRDNTGSSFPNLSSADINRKLNIDSEPVKCATIEKPVIKPSLDVVDHRLGISPFEPMEESQNGTEKHGMQHLGVMSSQKTFRRHPDIHGLVVPPPDHVPEMDTAPINPSELRERDAMRDRLANSCRPGMRKYSSSPNMRESSLLSGNYRLSRNLIPLRVPRNLIPEAEKENDDILSDIKPIEGTPAAAHPSGHTSGYISMNISNIDLSTPTAKPAPTPKSTITSDPQKSQLDVAMMPPPPRQVLSDISHKPFIKRQNSSDEMPDIPQCDSAKREKVPREMEVIHDVAPMREDNNVGPINTVPKRYIGPPYKVPPEPVEPPFSEKLPQDDKGCKVPQDNLGPAYNNVIQNNVKPMNNVPQGNFRYPVNVPLDNVRPSSNVPQNNMRPSSNVPHDNVRPSSNVLQDNLRPSSNVPQDNLRPSSNVPQDNLRPSSNVPQDNMRPSSSVLQDNMRPSSSVLQDNMRPLNNAPQCNIRQANNVPQDNVRPSNNVLQSNPRPANNVPQDNEGPAKNVHQDHPAHKERMPEKMEVDHDIPKRKAEPVPQQQPHKVAVNSSSTADSKKPEVHSSKVQQGPQMIQVNGKPYTVIQVIGQGGSSKVYKVLDTSNFAILALKVVKLDDTKEQIIEGFKNEISLLKRLQYCPRVIQLHDFEIRDEEKRIYILMESGELDLDRHIKNLIQQEGKLSPIDVKYHWRSMLQAVAALHKEGIIHSDLKPSNFLLINGQLKLIDFGIAKTIQQDKTSIVTDCQVGTLNYMSPETIQENIGLTESGGKAVFKIGVKSDVWSLGCILYNMVYGYTPFQKIARQFAKFLAITDPNHVIQFPDIPDKNVLDVMKRCLNRDPKQRPSIEELLEHEYLN